MYLRPHKSWHLPSLYLFFFLTSIPDIYGTVFPIYLLIYINVRRIPLFKKNNYFIQNFRTKLNAIIQSWVFSNLAIKSNWNFYNFYHCDSWGFADSIDFEPAHITSPTSSALEKSYFCSPKETLWGPDSVSPNLCSLPRSHDPLSSPSPNYLFSLKLWLHTHTHTHTHAYTPKAGFRVLALWSCGTLNFIIVAHDMLHSSCPHLSCLLSVLWAPWSQCLAKSLRHCTHWHNKQIRNQKFCKHVFILGGGKVFFFFKEGKNV